MEFCKAFNAKTSAKDQEGLIIPVVITIFSDRSFTFITKTPPVPVLIKRAVGIAKGSAEPNKNRVGKITLKQVEEIAKIKMPDLNCFDRRSRHELRSKAPPGPWASTSKSRSSACAMQPAGDEFTISTDKALLNIALIHEYLSQRSYWARGRTLEVVRKSIEQSLCFGLYRGDEQVGFARVVTDGATFAWLCDVFILETERGRGLGKRLVQTVDRYPELQGLRRVLLATKDAHDLYQRYGGFTNLQSPDRWMERLAPDTKV